MRIQLIRKETVEDFVQQNPSGRIPFQEWLARIKYAFGKNQVHLFVCWIGTHKEYDKLCKINGQYSVSI